jgi:hypothetical protein
MGYKRHNAIVVTGWNESHVKSAREKAVEIFGFQSTWQIVSEIVNSPVNSYSSFFISPDGSKEGWLDSDNGNEKREAFKTWLLNAKKQSMYFDWVEVQYGDDSHVTRIVSHSDEADKEEE